MSANNWITLYVVDLKNRRWHAAGLFLTMEGVNKDVDLGPGWWTPTEMIDNPDCELFVMNDSRSMCQIRNNDTFESPTCAKYDRFVSVIDNTKEVLDD